MKKAGSGDENEKVNVQNPLQKSNSEPKELDSISKVEKDNNQKNKTTNFSINPPKILQRNSKLKKFTQVGTDKTKISDKQIQDIFQSDLKYDTTPLFNNYFRTSDGQSDKIAILPLPNEEDIWIELRENDWDRSLKGEVPKEFQDLLKPKKPGLYGKLIDGQTHEKVVSIEEALLKRSKNHLATFEFVKAIYEELPNNPQIIFYLSYCLHQISRFEDSNELIGKIFELDQMFKVDRKDLFYNQALNYLYLHEYKKALIAIQSYINYDRHNSISYIIRSIIQWNLGILTEVESSLSYAIKLEPNSFYPIYYRAVYYHDQKNYKNAIKDYKKCLSIDDSHFLTLLNIGGCYFEREDYYEAIKYFTKSIDISNDIQPANLIKSNNSNTIISSSSSFSANATAFDSLFLRALSHMKIKKYKESLDDFTRCTKIQPLHKYSYYNIGLLYMQQNHYLSAISYFNHLEQLGDLLSTTFFNRGVSYLELQRFTEAIKDFKRCIDFDSSNGFAFYNTGIAYFSLQKYNEALFFFEEAKKFESIKKFIPVYTFIAKSYYELKNFSNAHILVINQAIDANMNNHQQYKSENLLLFFMKAFVLFKLKQYKESLEWFSNCIQEKFKVNESFYYRGLILYTLGNFNDAKTHFLKSYQRGFTKAGIFLGRVFMHQFNFQQAIQIYSKVLEDIEKSAQKQNQVNNPVTSPRKTPKKGKKKKIRKIEMMALYQRGLGYYCLQQFESCKQDHEKLLNNNLKRSHTLYYHTIYILGNCYFYLSKYKIAISMFSKSIASKELKISSLHLRSLCYFQKKKFSDSINDLNNILKKSKKLSVSRKVKFLLLRGQCYQFSGSIKKATKDYEVSLRFKRIEAKKKEFLVAKIEENRKYDQNVEYIKLLDELKKEELIAKVNEGDLISIKGKLGKFMDHDLLINEEEKELKSKRRKLTEIEDKAIKEFNSYSEKYRIGENWEPKYHGEIVDAQYVDETTKITLANLQNCYFGQSKNQKEKENTKSKEPNINSKLQTPKNEEMQNKREQMKNEEKETRNNMMLATIEYRKKEYSKALKFFELSTKGIIKLKEERKKTDNGQFRNKIVPFFFFRSYGDTLIKLQKWKEACKIFEQQIALFQFDEESWFQIGTCYEKLKNPENALAGYMKFSELKKNKDRKGLQKIGEILFQLNRIDESLQYFNNAIKLDEEKQYYNVIKQRGLIYVSKKQYASAVHDLSFYLTQVDSDVDIRITLGYCLEELGYFKDAIKQFKKVGTFIKGRGKRELDKQTELNFELGMCYHRLLKYSEAMKYYQKACEYDKNNVTAVHNFGLCSFELNQFRNAIRSFNFVKLKNSKDINPYFNSGLTYSRSYAFEKAIKEFSVVIKLEPIHLQSYYERGMSYFILGKYMNARLDFTKIIDICNQKKDENTKKGNNQQNRNLPIMEKARFRIACCYMKEKDYKKAEIQFGDILKTKKTDFFSFYNLAYVQMKRGKHEISLNNLKKCLKIRKNDLSILTNMGINNYRLQKYQTAFTQFQQVLKKNENHFASLFYMGCLKLDMKQYMQAIKYFGLALKERPGFELALLNRGISYQAINKYSEALNDFKFAIQINQSNIIAKKRKTLCEEEIKQKLQR